jgi:hypothetical protein
LTPTERMEANALVGRITTEDDECSQADVDRLVELIPLHAKPSLFSFGAGYRMTGGSTRGVAAGVGNVRIEGDERKGELSVGEDPIWRCGGYKITHTPGVLTIRQMFEDIDTMDDGRVCRVKYRRRPACVFLMCVRVLRLSIWSGVSFEVGVPTWKPWKVAASQ